MIVLTDELFDDLVEFAELKTKNNKKLIERIRNIKNAKEILLTP